MSHFALIENGIVRRVEVVKDCAIGGCIGVDHPDYVEGQHDDCGTLDFPAIEAQGQSFLAQHYGNDPAAWVQTSVTVRYRGKFAAIGDTWDGTEFATPAPPE